MSDTTETMPVDDRGESSALKQEDSKMLQGISNKKICDVCKDKASGMHFGVMSCEGCKGFFRRSIKKNANFTCAYSNNCGVNKENRRHCQACRFSACLAAGMKSTLILSDEEVVKKRDLIKMNRVKRLEQERARKRAQESERIKHLTEVGPVTPSARMTMNEKLLVEALLRAHEESYDFDYEEYDTFRGKDKITSPNKDKESGKTSLAWLVTCMSKSEKSPGGYSALHNPFRLLGFENRDIVSSIENRASSSGDTSRNQDNSEVFSSLHGISGEDTYNCKVSDNPADKNQNPTTSLALSSSESVPGASSSKNEGAECEMNVDSFSCLHSLLNKTQGHSLFHAEDSKSRHLLQHFCDIMTWGIKKVVDFCKSIPQFQSFDINDQIAMLRGGCLELLMLRSYFAFSAEDNKYISDKFQYQPHDFLQAGASVEFIEEYNNLHIRMRKMELQVEEICLLLALVLFSPDRVGIEHHSQVESVQNEFAKTLKAYEYSHKPSAQARTTYGEMLLILPLLRTINLLFANNLSSLQETNEEDMNLLILEINKE